MDGRVAKVGWEGYPPSPPDNPADKYGHDSQQLQLATTKDSCLSSILLITWLAMLIMGGEVATDGMG